MAVLVIHAIVDHVPIDSVWLGLNRKQIEKKLQVPQIEPIPTLVYRQLTRETEIPTLTAGRIPALKMSPDKNI